MFTLLSGNADKKNKKEESSEIKEARELFNLGRFPVVTTQSIENRPIAKVLGLVCCRGFDSEEAFFGMAAMAVKKGAQAIIGYNENIAFHPDGSKYFSCFGTAIMFEREARLDYIPDKKTIRDTLNQIPTAPMPNQAFVNNLQNDPLNPLNHGNLNHGQHVGNSDMNMDPGDFLKRIQYGDLQAQNNLPEPKRYPNQPSEEEDPVLRRLLASKKRQANETGWKQAMPQQNVQAQAMPQENIISQNEQEVPQDMQGQDIPQQSVQQAMPYQNMQQQAMQYKNMQQSMQQNTAQ